MKPKLSEVEKAAMKWYLARHRHYANTTTRSWNKTFNALQDANNALHSACAKAAALKE